MTQHLKRLVLAVLLLGQTACGTLNGPLGGVVIDKSTGQPVEGAIVVAHWEGDRFHPVDANTVCFHVETATTDEEGKFRIAAFVPAPFGVLNAGSYVAGVYKEGYREVSYDDTQQPGFEATPEGVEYLIPFSGDVRQRIDYLARLKSKASCSEAAENERNVLPLFKSIFYEAKTIAITDEDRKWVNRFRRSAASVATASDKDMTGDEYRQLIDEYLQDNLK